MPRFNFDDDEKLDFSNPQEMYADYKKKEIKGILNYQSEIIDRYMDEAYSKKDVAIELPTGSGKTLVGLLIGEYRRKKENLKVVYVCPTNQLVNQVVDKSNNEYGINVVGFTGQQSQYNSQNVSSYRSSGVMAVTNYSSIFNINSFFQDADIFIFDDAHSSENYIAQNWTLSVNKTENSDLFTALCECLKPAIDKSSYRRLVEGTSASSDDAWCDLVPLIKQYEIIEEIYQIINPRVASTNLQYPWLNIKENLLACNIYLSKNEIVIRPYISLTSKHNAFNNAKQRIYMSATLGISGELERTVGVSKIQRISMQENSTPSIGRRLFIFPNAKFSPKSNNEIFQKLKSKTPRCLMLVESNADVNRTKKELSVNSPEMQIFLAKQMESSLQEFEKSDNAVAILANRYDGLNLQDDTCHFLVLNGLPSTTHLQEKFFVNKLSTSVLYSERIKTRITQAVGRCTRSASDYAVVMVVGRELENILISPDKLKLFDSELRAELEVGFLVSTQAEDINDLIDIANLGFTRENEWDEIESHIIKKRNQYRKSEEFYNSEIYKQLEEASEFEVNFQNLLWMNDFDAALDNVEKILEVIKARDLGGYRQYWNYIYASLQDICYRENGSEICRLKANEYYEKAAKFSKTITWFRNLKQNLTKTEENVIDNLENSDIFDRIENTLESTRANQRIWKFETESAQTIKLLKSDGVNFEKGIELLGALLGYDANNSTKSGAPDPWWILNEHIVVVSENKIYENVTKKIPLKDVRESSGHPNWIRGNIDTLADDAEIINIFITNTSIIEPSATIQAEGIYYVNRDELISFAEKALASISSVRKKYVSEGKLSWRIEAENILNENKVAPKHFIDFVKAQPLNELSVN